MLTTAALFQLLEQLRVVAREREVGDRHGAHRAGRFVWHAQVGRPEAKCNGPMLPTSTRSS